MDRSTFERRREWWLAGAGAGGLLLAIGLFTAALTGGDTRALYLTFVRVGGAIWIAYGLHCWYRADEYERFYDGVDRSERAGDRPTSPISANARPYVNGALFLCFGLALVGLPIGAL